VATKSGQQEPEKAEVIEEMLDGLDSALDRVKVLYEQFFLGIQKQPPTFLHADIERKTRDLTQMQIRNTALRYRFATLTQKFGSYNSYWRRTLRQIENGTYTRNLSKIGRQAARTGADVPEEILAAMPKRMREQVKRDRDAAIAQARRREKKPSDPAELMTLTEDDVEIDVGDLGARDAGGAHRIAEDDGDFDLDAFFAKVTSEGDPDPLPIGPAAGARPSEAARAAEWGDASGRAAGAARPPRLRTGSSGHPRPAAMARRPEAVPTEIDNDAQTNVIPTVDPSARGARLDAPPARVEVARDAATTPIAKLETAQTTLISTVDSGRTAPIPRAATPPPVPPRGPPRTQALPRLGTDPAGVPQTGAPGAGHAATGASNAASGAGNAAAGAGPGNAASGSVAGPRNAATGAGNAAAGAGPGNAAPGSAAAAGAGPGNAAPGSAAAGVVAAPVGGPQTARTLGAPPPPRPQPPAAIPPVAASASGSIPRVSEAAPAPPSASPSSGGVPMPASGPATAKLPPVKPIVKPPAFAPSQATRPSPVAPGASARTAMPVETLAGPFPRIPSLPPITAPPPQRTAPEAAPVAARADDTAPNPAPPVHRPEPRIPSPRPPAPAASAGPAEVRPPPIASERPARAEPAARADAARPDPAERSDAPPARAASDAAEPVRPAPPARPASDATEPARPTPAARAASDAAEPVRPAPPARPASDATEPARPTPAARPASEAEPVRPAPPGRPARPRVAVARPAGERPAPRPASERPEPPPRQAPPPGMSDADVNALYAKYVQAKQILGEDAGPGAYGKLLKTINAQAPKIMEQYKSKGVDFSVVVKDNQVVIRAKPKP
jgi:syndecan 1